MVLEAAQLPFSKPHDYFSGPKPHDGRYGHAGRHGHGATKLIILLWLAVLKRFACRVRTCKDKEWACKEACSPECHPSKAWAAFPSNRYTLLQNVWCLLHLHAHYTLIPVFFCRVTAMLVDFNARSAGTPAVLVPCPRANHLDWLTFTYTFFPRVSVVGVLRIPLQKVKDIVSAKEVLIY